MTRVRLSLMTLLAVLALPAPLAHASAYTRVLGAYQLSGSIPPCEFSSAQLSSALKGVDTYGAQYFADFTNAIQAALAARASGQCAPARQSGVAPVGTTSKPRPAAPAAAPGPVTAPTGAGIPAPIVLMAAIAAVMLLIATIGSVGRGRGWDPAWAAGWRHAWGEAGHRTGGTWAEFRDWLRS